MRYRDMAASRNKPFSLQHCWTLLEDSEKWRLRDQEAPPPKIGSAINLDEEDEEDDDEPKAKRGRPDGTKKVKAELKRKAKHEKLRDKIGDMMKHKVIVAQQQLEAKIKLAEKREDDKMKMWLATREDEKRKAEFEEQRIHLEEDKARAAIIADETRVMTMDPHKMDPITREWWDDRRLEILEARKARRAAAATASAAPAATATANGGGDHHGLDDAYYVACIWS
jgi:hypothetical protein